jgi:hypothetical protein
LLLIEKYSTYFLRFLQENADRISKQAGRRMNASLAQAANRLQVMEQLKRGNKYAEPATWMRPAVDRKQDACYLPPAFEQAMI